MMLLFDGAMGTMLQQAGLPAGACPEVWCLDRPDQVTAIHRQYINAGADIIETNTFGANRIKLAHYGLANAVNPICFAAVRAARAACGPNTRVAGSVGPTGRLLEPVGDLPFEAAYEAFKEQITALDQAGADMILIETIIDIQEMRAALLAAKATTTKPVICQLTFEKDGRTVTGTDPQTAVVILDKLGADVIGANCSLGPEQLLNIAQQMAIVTTKPISIQANAGLPELNDGHTHYPMGPDEFAAWIPKLATAGVSYIGGCCGTTPSHIRTARTVIDKQNSACAKSLDAGRSLSCVIPTERISKLILSDRGKLSCQTKKHLAEEKTVILASRSQRVYIGKDFPTAIIGERINPTGRKTMAAELRQGNMQSVKHEALAQVRAGAALLDINLGVPGLDQALMMRKTVEELAMLTNVPFAIDTTDADALEAGLRAFPGRAMVNSVSAEPERMERFLPIAKKYGAAVLCLPLSESGVPTTAAERVAVVKQIITTAKQAGLTDSDLLLDALTLTVAADSQAAMETLHTLAAYREHFGYPAVMGLSNVSFGLPRRDLLNAAFCSMALSAGLDAPILNPYDPLMKDILAASAVLLGKDQHAKSYSFTYAQSVAPQTSQTSLPSSPLLPTAQASDGTDILTKIKQCVIDGEKEQVRALVEQALAAGRAPLDITDYALTGAMNELGHAFGTGQIFLPQVLLSAETMKNAFQTLRAMLPSQQTVSRGTIILATVKGDIHDLGKNIVAALLENNGFSVIDLGKDISAEQVVAAAIQNKADIVGLCALMTTTLPQIDATIAQLRKAGCQVPVIAGGAVLTEDYAKAAGASYAADAVAAVNICKALINR